MNLDPRVFPTILMILDFIAAIPYAVHGDIRHAVYWVAAGVLTKGRSQAYAFYGVGKTLR